MPRVHQLTRLFVEVCNADGWRNPHAQSIGDLAIGDLVHYYSGVFRNDRLPWRVGGHDEEGLTFHGACAEMEHHNVPVAGGVDFEGG